MKKRTLLKGWLVEYAALSGVLALLVAAFGLGSDNFLQPSTMVSIANQIPDLTFVAVGMTMVLIIGGIDLSVGSLLALSSAILGVLIAKQQWPVWTALPVAFAVSSCCGWLNGRITIRWGVPAFIVTLGTLEIARGAAKSVTGSQSIYIGKPIEWFGEPLELIRLSPAFFAAAVSVLAGQFLLTQTVFGRHCVAIGANSEAARMSGVPVEPCSEKVYILSGLLCGLAGWAQAARLSSSDPNAAVGIELSAIAACVIGGTSLMGGRGNVVSTFLGVLIIQVLQTGLAQVGVSDANKQIVTGAVIIVAVMLDTMRRR